MIVPTFIYNTGSGDIDFTPTWPPMVTITLFTEMEKTIWTY